MSCALSFHHTSFKPGLWCGSLQCTDFIFIILNSRYFLAFKLTNSNLSMNDAVSEDEGLGLPGSGPAVASLLNGGPGLRVGYDDGVSNSDPVANMGEFYGEAEDEDEDEDDIVATASEARNHSRLSSSAAPARTPSKRSTPASAPASASAPTTAGAGRGRKRKAAAVETEADPVPAKRRGRPPGPTSARLVAKAVKKETGGRPKRQQASTVSPPGCLTSTSSA